MTLGLVISVVLHVSLLGFALVSVAATPAREPKVPMPEPIVVDVITASELNRMRKGVREAKLDDAMQKDVKKPDEAKKDTPKPKPVVATPPPPAAAEPPPLAPEPPKPVEVAKAEPPPPPKAPEPPKEPEPPKPEPDKAALDKVLDDLALQKADEEKAKAEQALKAKAAAAAAAKAEADAKAKAEADAKARMDKAIAKAKEDKAKADKIAKEKAKQLDTTKLSALLDKTPDPKQAAAANEAPTKPTNAKGPVKGAAEGKDQTISANEKAVLLNLIIDTVKKCWNVHAGGQAAGGHVPKVRWELNPDGTLRGSPKLLNPQSSPQFQLAADAAMRAVVECNRFTLPPDLYQSWKTVTLDFDPNDFLQ